jgi:hypothetical protein
MSLIEKGATTSRNSNYGISGCRSNNYYNRHNYNVSYIQTTNCSLGKVIQTNDIYFVTIDLSLCKNDFRRYLSNENFNLEFN